MSDTIPLAYIDSFEANVRHLSQQQEARLIRYVDTNSDTGKSHRWDRIAASEAAVKGSRVSDPANNRLVQMLGMLSSARFLLGRSDMCCLSQCAVSGLLTRLALLGWELELGVMLSRLLC